MVNMYTDLHLRGNKVIAIVIDPVTSNPATGKPGQLIFRTDLNEMFFYANSQWNAFGDITAVVTNPTTSGLSGGANSGSVDLALKKDDVTIGIDGTTGNVIVKDAGIGTAKLADGAVNTAKLADGAVTLPKMLQIATSNVLGRMTVGTGNVELVVVLNEGDMVSNRADALATQQSIKTYVDSKLGLAGGFRGDYDVAANTPNFPTETGGVKQGSMWVASTSGTLGVGTTVAIRQGDIIMAKQVNASQTNPAHWLIFEGNRPDATETVFGIIRLATAAEVIAGTLDAGVAVSPARLVAYIDSRVNPHVVQITGDGVLTTFDVTTTVTAVYPTVEVIDDTSKAVVHVETELTSPGLVRLIFGVPPAMGKIYNVVIKPV